MLPLKPHHMQKAFLVRIMNHEIAGYGGFQRLQPALQTYLEDSGIEEFRIFVVSGGKYSVPFEVEANQPLPSIKGMISADTTTLLPPLNLANGYYYLVSPPDLEPWVDAKMGSDRTVYIDVESDLDAAKLMLFL